MSNKSSNFSGSVFIEPMIGNDEPEFVTVITILTPSGVDGDALAVTFPSNEHFEFDSTHEEFNKPDLLIGCIANRDWESDLDVPHMIRIFMTQQVEFIEKIENDLWLLEIDSESKAGEILTNFYPGKMDKVFRDWTEIEEGLELEHI